MYGENYERARTLATVQHLGVTFRVVRERINGKPWRKYLQLVAPDGTPCSGEYREGDPQVEAARWAAKMQYHFPVNSPESQKRIVETLALLKRKHDAAKRA